MGIPQINSSLSLELKIVEAKSVESKPRGDLFVRCYLPVGSNKRKVGIDTKEIPTKKDHVWNETFSLECSGIEDNKVDITKLIKQEKLVLELRWRNRVPILGRSGFGGSKLLGSGEIAWKDVSESPNMVLDKWVTMAHSSGELKPAKLKVKISVKVLSEEHIFENKNSSVTEECGCKDSHNHNHALYACDEYYDVLALTAALDAL
ncbi:hypothetical protein F8388_020171 [Cannabis sativa]|uniref:C2 domain-containing protein n=1 Tax=Cannabis sativa TaxID=3483 RepID=A0A7J6HZR8_CANSA|nr:hypothetical protein F8388_020171 [Cannabis sativa]KAF4400475.1 hypothetical protein G4B88_023268 [Cannabis sativa]